MKAFTTVAQAVFVLFFAGLPWRSASGQSNVILAESHFDDTNSLDQTIRADGWRGINDAGGGETREFSFGGATTNSTGYISVRETAGDGSTMYFSAPAKYLGDQRRAYNGFLRFAHRQDATSQQTGGGSFVQIGSPTMTLVFSLRGTPGTAWRFHDIPLNENVGWLNVTSNRFATKADFMEVLKSVTRLWIRAEFSYENVDQSDLDDVALVGQSSGPLQPVLSAAPMVGITIDGEIGRAYRIEYRLAFDAGQTWQKLADVVPSTSPYLFVDQSVQRSSQRFYRVVLNE